MFELRRHNVDKAHMPCSYTDLVSRHHTMKAAQAALEAAQAADPNGQRLFIVKPTRLVTGTGKLTGAYYRIKAACHPNGTTVTKRAKGFSDYPDLMALVSEGLLEIRNKGPRGGQTWHATRKGRRHMVKAETQIVSKENPETAKFINRVFQ